MNYRDCALLTIGVTDEEHCYHGDPGAKVISRDSVNAHEQAIFKFVHNFSEVPYMAIVILRKSIARTFNYHAVYLHLRARRLCASIPIPPSQLWMQGNVSIVNVKGIPCTGDLAHFKDYR